MKFNKWFLFLIPIIAILAYFSIPTAKPVDETGENVLKIRRDKDSALQDDEESPIKDKTQFKGLKYYPFNKDYVVDFVLEKAEKAKTVELKMTDGTTEKLILFAFMISPVALSITTATPCMLLMLDVAGTLYVNE